MKLDKVFDQYLRTTMVPVLEWSIVESTLWYRWTSVVEEFDMAVRVGLGGGFEVRLSPVEAWQGIAAPADATELVVDPDFYVESRRVER